MRIYITGGTGFIGSFVVKEFADGKNDIIVLARNPKKVPALLNLPRVKVQKLDLLKRDSIAKAMKNPDALVHVALTWGEGGPAMLCNETLSSVMLIEDALKKGAQRIIYTSSTAAQGNHIRRDVFEHDKPVPDGFYGAGKGAVEAFVSAYSHLYPKAHINVIRPGYTFGNPVLPGSNMEGDRRFKDICVNARAGKPIVLTRHDGTQFISGGDLAKVYRKVLLSSARNETFYGLGANHITWEQVARWAVALCKYKSVIKVIDKGYGAKPPLFRVDKIRKFFGLSFNGAKPVKEHVKYLLENYQVS